MFQDIHQIWPGRPCLDHLHTLPLEQFLHGSPVVLQTPEILGSCGASFFSSIAALSFCSRACRSNSPSLPSRTVICCSFLSTNFWLYFLKDTNLAESNLSSFSRYLVYFSSYLYLAARVAIELGYLYTDFSKILSTSEAAFLPSS